MRIGFVLQDPASSSPTGLDTYTWKLWDALRSLDGEHDLVPITLPRRFAARAYLRAMWEQLYLPLWARWRNIDLLHVPAGSSPVVRTVPCVLTLHDLGQEASPAYRTPLGPRLYFGRVVPWSARFATALVCDSEATKRDAVERLGVLEERITVVPLAPASCFRKLPEDAVDEVRRRHGLSERYFLQVGARIPRKNLSGALAGFARFVRRCADPETQFVVVGGRGFGDQALPPEAATLAQDGRVRFLGQVPQDDLIALYNGALAVVLPSFYEGFGLPLVEAFACGTPVIASRVASLPEVAGDAALYVDPHDPDTIAGAMEQYATSPELRAAMARRASKRSRRFSWRKTAGETLAVYRRVWEEHRVRPRGPARYAPSAAPKVLFVRLDGLGDVALTTPCFEAVKRRYPDARVDVVVRPAATPLLEGDPHVDRVLTLEAPWHGRWRLGSIRDVWLMARRLRRERYDYVLTLRRDLDDAVFARLCGGRHTLGFYARRTRPFLSGWRDFRPDLHTAENQLRLMALLGCERDGLRPTVACTSGDPQRIDALLGDAAGERTLIGLAPFGSSETKTIPASQAGALIDALATSMPARLVLLGSAADRPRADAVLGAASAPVVDLAGRTTIPELCDVLRRCRLVVCVDSGPMHLAAALGVPTVVLFGGEDPVLWGPYGDAPHQVLRVLDARRRAAVRAIPLEMVLAAVRELLQTTQTAAVRPREPGEVTA